jgi:hypothetical protein
MNDVGNDTAHDGLLPSWVEIRNYSTLTGKCGASLTRSVDFFLQHLTNKSIKNFQISCNGFFEDESFLSLLSILLH